MVAFIEVTKNCNLRCDFCDIWRIQVGPNDEMTRTEMFHLIHDLRDLGTKYLGLFGGEIMLRRDLFDIIGEAKRLGLYVYVCTNGYLLPQFYGQVLDSGINALAVSLDGSQPEVHDHLRGVKGGFDRIIEGLQKIQSQEHAIKLVINTVIFKQNFRELLDIVRLGTALGVRYHRFLAYNFIAPYNLCAQQSHELILDEGEIEELSGRLEDLISYCRAHRVILNSHDFLRGIPLFYRNSHPPQRCFAGYASISVHADGRLSFCASREAPIGNIREKRLGDIWHSAQFNETRRHLMSDLCDKCWVSCFIEQNHWFSPIDLFSKAVGFE